MPESGAFGSTLGKTVSQKGIFDVVKKAISNHTRFSAHRVRAGDAISSIRGCLCIVAEAFGEIHLKLSSST